MRNEYKILVGKPKGKIALGLHRRRWKAKINLDFKEGV
jgi:hypothetical protein